MSGEFVIDAEEYAGRRIVIKMPPAPKRTYISCNKECWDTNVDTSVLEADSDFLWNFEQGHKVIYSSSIIKITQKKPVLLDFSIPIWSLTPQSVLLNDKPFVKFDDCVHDFSGEGLSVVLDQFVASAVFQCPVVIFSGKVDNGFGLFIEVFTEINDIKKPIWSTTIPLKDSSNYKRAKYKNKEYYVWDSVITDKFKVDTNLDLEASVRDGVSLGVTVKFVSTSDVYLGQREDDNSFFFSIKDLRYILQFEDC